MTTAGPGSPGASPGAWKVDERLGRPVRHFTVAVSAEAQGLAWARQENAPHGALVLVDAEVSARGRLGHLWWAAPNDTLACALVLRPKVGVEEADVAWLIAGVAAAESVEAVTGRKLATWWPDALVDPDTGENVVTIKTEVQLGPGMVRSAVAAVRFDLARLGLDRARREELLDGLLRSLDALDEKGTEVADTAAAAYEGRCKLLGERVKISLRPKGETRGIARHVDRKGRLELQSSTGMVEHISLDMLGELHVV